MVRLAARTDANQSAIVAALRRIGAAVACTHQLGAGFPDLVVAYGGRNFLLEVKMPGEGLTGDEPEWHAQWATRGQVDVVTTPEEAIEVVTRDRRPAGWW